jgi:NAD(P)H-dependent FMN reductase
MTTGQTRDVDDESRGRPDMTARTATPRIELIVASTRSTRFADPVTAWVRDTLEPRGDLELGVIDVRDVGLPAYDLPTPPALAHRQYATDEQRALGERLDAADGFIVITHEFNHGYSAPLKNLLDHYFVELEHKPIAFIGYGNVGGARAIEQLRQVVAELSMVSVRESVHVLGYQFPAVRSGGEPASQALAMLEPRLTTMTDHLLWWARALTAARAISA